MSILRMKRLRIIAPSNIRKRLISDLSKLGCLDIESANKLLEDPEWSALLHRVENESVASEQLTLISDALKVMSKYAPVKKGLLSPKRTITEAEFTDESSLQKALEMAKSILADVDSLSSLTSESVRLTAKKASFIPWENLDIPLDFETDGKISFLIGTSPATFSFDDMRQTLEETVPACEIQSISKDREQHCLSVICLKDDVNAVLSALKPFGFNRSSFKGITGTAAENISQINARLKEVENLQSSITEKLSSYQDVHLLLEQAFDKLTLEAAKDSAMANLSETMQTTYIDGWVPSEVADKVEAVLQKHVCAYEFSDPTENDNPPVCLRNGPVVAPFGFVTELYSLPAYNSLIDPNPFMAPFFFCFFGMMMGDVGYGLVLLIAGLAALKMLKPAKGSSTQNLVLFVIYCSIGMIVWGILFGSYFGDLVQQLSKMITGTEYAIKPLLFDPLKEPMALFILSLALGLIQILVGLGVSGLRQIKRGEWFDAICDVGFWYLILIGLGLALVGVPYSLYVALAGAIGVVLTGGRHSKGFGKITGGLGALYGISGYFSDILSYSRLLALGLATAVVASVMNIMGTLGGNSIVGWILFVVVFLIGHAFNLLINLLGSFVHTSRLQFIEFFGKFYEPGDRGYKPLTLKTKYVNITKEEN